MLPQNHLEILGPPASSRAELTRCLGIADAKKVREPESGAACLVPKPTECDFHFGQSGWEEVAPDGGGGFTPTNVISGRVGSCEWEK